MADLNAGVERAEFEIRKSAQQALVYDVLRKDGHALSTQEYKSINQAIYSINDLFEIDRVRVLAEGDSWINILWPISSALGFDRTFFDVIQLTGKYDTKDLGYPGHLFDDIIRAKEYLPELQRKRYGYFIFSGGGNDLLGGGALRRLLKDRDQTSADGDPESWFDKRRLDAVFAKLKIGYEELADETRFHSFGQTQLLLHGYDYPIPRSGEPWLGEPLEDRGYDLEKDFPQIKKLFQYLIDRFYDTLALISENRSHVHLLNLRNIVGDRWNDELHPKASASRDIASRFISKMQEQASIV